MVLESLLLALGLVLLYFGSSKLVEGAAATAIMFSVRPVIVGLTVVSLATSAPELLVSLVAAAKGSGGISLGNILGSNVINIALVLGASAVIRPVAVKRQVARIEIPYMLIVSTVFWLLCMDGRIGRFDGIVLLILLAVFLGYGMITASEKNRGSAVPRDRSLKVLAKHAAYILVGLVMLAAGADLVVRNAIIMAESIGLSQTFIGISVVALGTSLPELATSVIAAARGESDISVGNVVGSNLFNICLVMGVVGLLNPLDVEASLHWFEFPFMVLVCLILWAIAFVTGGVGKKGGILFIVLFGLYIGVSYVR